MLALVLILLFQIQPVPGVASVELDPSDPQQNNEQQIRRCISFTGLCNVWYLPGSYRITKTIQIPRGVENIYFQNTDIVPCAPMSYAFNVQGWPGTPPGAVPQPVFHGMKIDHTQACGSFKPGLFFMDVKWP